jgi:hypothetical protein
VAIWDVLGNPVELILIFDAIEVASFENDAQPPILLVFDFLLNSSQVFELIFVFSEKVNGSTLNTGAI